MKHLFVIAAIAIITAAPAAVAQTTSSNPFIPKQSEYQKQQEEMAKQQSLNSGYGVPPMNDPAGQNSLVNPYDDKFKKNFPKPGEEPDKDVVNLLQQGSYLIFFLRDSTNPDQAVLRLSSKESMSGCLTVTPPVITFEENPPTITYKIKGAITKIDRSARYAHYECKSGGQFPHADIVLNRKELMDKGITKIGLRSDKNPVTDYFDVTLTADNITLSPVKAPGAFQPMYKSGAPDPLSYEFKKARD